ncbi:hypothetical protein F5J12DRAFT_786847 [Pisolithus orientalis]|uniref:uncharacterized protein n=1 Tax=Pisolithus orientalis TaxID=936130 RepID=UPI0022251A14|nr:uncharacterized protein F5J12DRAFT_786847 [Pisolithus orientalis]KAI5988485.1 hypothetical protein F5J12DRAFT_786847 [Pisolithus orientalis]
MSGQVSYHMNSEDKECMDRDNNNDVVTLLCSGQGQLYTSTQMQDYLQHSTELEELSLLTFMCDTWEECYTPKDEEQSPWLPCHDDSNTYDFYCTCMLALLKPWQIAADLKGKDKGWSAAFECMNSSNTPWVTCVLASLQYYYDSKTACKTASVPAVGGDVPQLEGWMTTMHTMVDSANQNQMSVMANDEMDQGSVIEKNGMAGIDAGGTYMLAQLFVMGGCPNQLCMIIPGEGGVGKLKMIQMIMDNLAC